MAGYDRDEAYMSRTHSMSISIPMSSMDGDMNRQDKVDENWKKFFAIWKKIFVICCLVAIFLDPLFFLLLSVQHDNKCIDIDWPKAKTMLVVFRSVTDFVYLLNILLKLWRDWRAYGVYLLNKLLKFQRAPESRVDQPTRIAQNYLKGCFFFFVDIFLMLPLPQILILSVLPKSLGSSGANDAKNLILSAILIQYIPRLFRFLPLLVGLIFETAWANFFINLFTFVLSGHVIGSWWYLLGFQRVKQCLREACDATGFGDCLQFIDCGDKNVRKNGTQTNPIWESWKNNKNATACFSGDSFAYGIYKPAVNLTSKNITTRYVSSLFWGFQQISTLAGNQEPSDFVGEVLFTMLIIVLGLLLFAFLIGNMQNFLQAFDKRKQEFLLRRRDIKQWMRHRSLPKPLKKRVIAAEKYKWAATRGVNERMLIENLPEDIQKDIRRHIMFDFVKRVPSFTSMDRHILDAICGKLKQTIYIKGSEILYPGAVVDKMVFIVHGKLKSIGNDRTVTLREGSVCGEELLTWFHEHASVSKDGKKIKVTGQRSTRRVKCLTDVEAFSLGAADLEEFTDHFANLKKTERSPPEGPK